MKTKKSKLILLLVIGLWGIMGWQYWDYYYNTPVAIQDNEEVYRLEHVSHISDRHITFHGSKQKLSRDVSWLVVLNRKGEGMDISVHSALFLSR